MTGSTPIDGFAPFDNGMINIPERIPVFPLRGVVLLPGEVLPLHIFEPRYRAMIQDALAGHRLIGMVEELAVDAGGFETPAPPIEKIGCVGFIAEHKELRDGRFLIWLLGLERFFIDEEIDADTLYRQARVIYSPIHESAEAAAGLQPVRSELRKILPRLVNLDDDDRGTLEQQMSEITDSQLIALACQILELPGARKRELLEAENQADRFMLVYEDLYRFLAGRPDLDDTDASILN